MLALANTWMSILRRILLLSLALLVATSSMAGTEQHPKLWFGGDLDAQLSSSKYWRYNLFTQSRFGDNESTFEQYILQPSVYYKYADGLSFWLGYSFMPTVSSSRVSALLEQRIWPQVQYTIKVNPVHTLTFRTRLEERWREESSQSAPRLRQRIEYSYNNFIKPDVALDIFDEIFITLHNADWVAPQAVNQNRVFIGFAMPINHHSALDFGYMNIFRPRSPQNNVDHVFVVALSLDVQKISVSPILAI